MALQIRFRGDQSDHDVLSKALAEIASLRNDVHQLQIRQPPIGAALNSTDGGSFGGKIKGARPLAKTLAPMWSLSGPISATVVNYDGTGSNGTIQVYPDRMRGYMPTDSIVEVAWSAEAEKWYCRDDGITADFVTLTSDLVYGSTATAISADGGNTITVYTWGEFPAGTTRIKSGKKLVVLWRERQGKWYEPGGACPE